MDKKLIIEDVKRINTVFKTLNIPTKDENLVINKLVLEVASVPPQILGSWARGIESFFDKGNVKNIVEREIDKLGTISRNLPLERRLEQWINHSIGTQAGEDAIRRLIKTASQESREYTDYFINEATSIFEDLESQYGIDKALETIESSFGKTIRDAYQRISSGGSIEKVIKKINVTNSRTKILTYWEKYLSSNSYVMDGLKPIINIYVKSAKRKSMKLEKYVEEMFDKLVPVTNIVQNYGQVDNLPNASTIFRETNAMVHGLTVNKEYMVNFDQVYRAIKQKLMQPLNQGGFGLELRQADVIIDGLKNENPFKHEYFTSKTKLKLWKFLDETTVMDWWRFMRNKEKTLGQKFVESVKRLNMVGLYGNIKYVKDWQYFIDKYGTRKGTLVAYGYMQASAHLILPFYIGFFTGLFRTFRSLFQHMSKEDKKSLWDQLVAAESEAYTNAFTPPDGSTFDKSVWWTQTILPFHTMYLKWIQHIGEVFGYDVGGEFADLFDDAEHKVEDITKIDSVQKTPEECLSKYPCLGENGGKVIRNSLGMNLWVSPDGREFALISYKDTLRIIIPSQGGEGVYIDCRTFKNIIPNNGGGNDNGGDTQPVSPVNPEQDKKEEDLGA
jgi:hypothetical protein